MHKFSNKMFIKYKNFLPYLLNVYFFLRFFLSLQNVEVVIKLWKTHKAVKFVFLILIRFCKSISKLPINHNFNYILVLFEWTILNCHLNRYYSILNKVNTKKNSFVLNESNIFDYKNVIIKHWTIQNIRKQNSSTYIIHNYIRRAMWISLLYNIIVNHREYNSLFSLEINTINILRWLLK